MGFPSFDYRPALDEGFRTSRQLATNVRRNWVDRQRPLFTTQSQKAAAIFEITDDLARYIARWNEIAALPGMGAYARAQFSEPERDIAAEFTAMVAAAQGVIDWTVSAFPKDADGYLLRETFGTGTERHDRTFTPQQLGGFVAAMDALAATID